MSNLEPSTPESRASHEAQRAGDYPLPDERLEPLRASLAGRLREAGVALPPEEFDALVLDMARFALKWSRGEVQARAEAKESEARDQAARSGRPERRSD
jgi:hypothetical protein